MVSLTEENYLKAMLSLAKEKGEVSINELSKHLGIKMPTANSMMKKLAEKDLVVYETYKPLKLTEKGKTTAALILRKHRLTEMFLVHKMGFGWEEVHPIAEQIEHIHSSVFFEKMDELLGYPKFDPHGSPIPDKNGKMEWLSFRALNKCTVGSQVSLAAVLDSSEDFLKFLNAKAIKLNDSILVIDVEEYDGSMTLQIGQQKNIVLSAMVCEKLLVR